MIVAVAAPVIVAVHVHGNGPVHVHEIDRVDHAHGSVPVHVHGHDHDAGHGPTATGLVVPAAPTYVCRSPSTASRRLARTAGKIVASRQIARVTAATPTISGMGISTGSWPIM